MIISLHSDSTLFSSSLPLYPVFYTENHPSPQHLVREEASTTNPRTNTRCLHQENVTGRSANPHHRSQYSLKMYLVFLNAVALPQPLIWGPWRIFEVYTGSDQWVPVLDDSKALRYRNNMASEKAGPYGSLPRLPPVRTLDKMIGREG